MVKAKYIRLWVTSGTKSEDSWWRTLRLSEGVWETEGAAIGFELILGIIWESWFASCDLLIFGCDGIL